VYQKTRKFLTTQIFLCNLRKKVRFLGAEKQKDPCTLSRKEGGKKRDISSCKRKSITNWLVRNCTEQEQGLHPSAKSST
jgi:hypothetical protein